MGLDHTHAADATSWVASANDGTTEFPIQNLPLGIFSTALKGPRCGVAIGDKILDLKLAAERGLISAPLASAVGGESFDPLFALGRKAMRQLRHELFALLHCDAEVRDEDLLVVMTACTMHVPSSVRSFTDFYVGIHHVIRCAEVLGQGDNPLPPNYNIMPLGYNGRASTVRVSGEPVRRPIGLRKPLGQDRPSFGASEWLDFELEMGFYIGSGNAIGEPVAIADAEDQVVGFCLLNDWSARDIQLFEMAPLGAFNSKSLSTTISPWVVTADAMEPFRIRAMDRMPGAAPIPTYLDSASDRETGGIDVTLTATISTEAMRAAGQKPARLLETSSRYLYWTCAQMVAQQSITGCRLAPGDLIGTGTISGPDQQSYASMFELSAGTREPIQLPNGENRSFLENGDEVSFSGRCEREGFASIGFGTCMARIAPAIEWVQADAA